MRTKFRMGTAICFFLFTFLCISGLNAATITFEPFNPTVTQGDIFSINIVAQNFPETTGGDVYLVWDPLLLTLDGYTITWPGDTPPAVVPSIPGRVEFSFGDFAAPNPSGNFGLVNLTFEASLANIGTTLFNIITDFWADPNFDLFDPQPTGVGGSITVNAVPIPAAAWLLGTGLVGLVALRRRNRA
jgi:hypothetical protein